MLRGCEKRVVHIKNPDNPHFEEIYLFLKEDAAPNIPQGELWREAEKIIEHCAYKDEIPSFSSPSRGKNLLSFSFGALTGTLAFMLAFLFV